MIEWSISAAINADCFDRIIVSTDDSEISKLAKSSGAEVWEDRSYGNSSENDDYESGRSRRKRGISNGNNSSNE